jgi:hypothetical protein
VKCSEREREQLVRDGGDSRRDELPPHGGLRVPLRRGKRLRVPLNSGVRIGKGYCYLIGALLAHWLHRIYLVSQGLRAEETECFFAGHQREKASSSSQGCHLTVVRVL